MNFGGIVSGVIHSDAWKSRQALGHTAARHQRQENAERYYTLFETTGLLEKVDLPKPVYKNDHVPRYHIYNQFVIRTQARDRLQVHLKQRGIGTEIYYPVPFHLQECFRYLGYKEGNFPESERAAREVLALPIYPGLTLDQQKYVVDSIRDFYSKEVK